MHLVDVSRVEAARRLQMRRLVMPSAGVESWTLIGPDHRPVALIDEYLAWLARWISGDSLGDPTADEIWTLAKDRSQGVPRTEVRDLFSRNKKAREIDRALGVLEDAGRLSRTSAPDGRGRPAESWVPVRIAA